MGRLGKVDSNGLEILCLGAGVQSSTVLLMAIHGLLRKLDYAIFADTGWEPSAVYRWLYDFLIPKAQDAGINDPDMRQATEQDFSLGCYGFLALPKDAGLSSIKPNVADLGDDFGLDPVGNIAFLSAVLERCRVHIAQMLVNKGFYVLESQIKRDLCTLL